MEIFYKMRRLLCNIVCAEYLKILEMKQLACLRNHLGIGITVARYQYFAIPLTFSKITFPQRESRLVWFLSTKSLSSVILLLQFLFNVSRSSGKNLMPSILRPLSFFHFTLWWHSSWCLEKPNLMPFVLASFTLEPVASSKHFNISKRCFNCVCSER